jgi:hypothetical protein
MGAGSRLEVEDRRLVCHGERASGLSNQQPGWLFALTAERGCLSREMANALRIAIVGSGAIGSYYGGKLAHGGSDLHFLMRGDLSEIRRDGLCVCGKVKIFASRK